MLDHEHSVNILKSGGFSKVLSLHDNREMSDDTNVMIYMCYSTNEQTLSNPCLPSVSLVHFSNLIGFGETVKESLINRGWHLTTHHYTMLDLTPEALVLVLDDVSNPLLPTISADQWRALLHLIGSGHKILWVTSGSQFQVSDPQIQCFTALPDQLEQRIRR